MGTFSQPLEQSTQLAIKETPHALSKDSVVAQSPLAVLDTVSGFSLAEDVLGRIEWGLVG
ncbi:hypothetical protein GCM10028773_23460 [Spirosoma koreense]